MQGRASLFVPSKAEWPAMLWGGVYALAVNAALAIVSTRIPYTPMTVGGGDPGFWERPVWFISQVLSDPTVWFLFKVRSDAGFLIGSFGVPGLLSSVLYGMLGGLMLYWILLRWAERGPLASREGWGVGAGIGALVAFAFTIQTVLAAFTHGEGFVGWLLGVGAFGTMICGTTLSLLLATLAGAIRGRHLVATLKKSGAAAVHSGTAKVAIQLGILGLLVVAAFAMYFIPAAVRQLVRVPPIPETFTIPGDFGILSQEPCPAPCFQGIIPGITSAQKAFQILWRIGPCKPVNLAPDAPPSAIGCSSGGGDILVEVFRRYEKTKSVVDTIMLRTPVKVTVGDFIDQYGPPDAVISTSDGGPDSYITLFFDRLQTSVSLRLRALVFPSSRPAPTDTIMPDTAVYSFTYYSAEHYQVLVQADRQPWKGYGRYTAEP